MLRCSRGFGTARIGSRGGRRSSIIFSITTANRTGARPRRKGLSRALLPGATGMPHINQVKTFNFNDYDYINNSIDRCFIGKACPWEIQETLQLASEVGAVTETNLLEFCRSSLGVDCGGFVANYWGEACPHMVKVNPLGWNGILPRGF